MGVPAVSALCAHSLQAASAELTLKLFLVSEESSVIEEEEEESFHTQPSLLAADTARQL